MGKLRFRTSYAQNVLDHSVEVSRLAASLAAELGLNVEIAKRAGLLHDIGKALGPEYEGPHALTGMEFLRKAGEKDAIIHAVGAHHHEIEPTTREFLQFVALTCPELRLAASTLMQGASYSRKRPLFPHKQLDYESKIDR